MSESVADKHLHIRSYGGTISCSEYIAGTGELYNPQVHGPKSENQIEYLPESGKIEYLVRNHVNEATRNLFGVDGANIIFSEADEIKDSAEFTTDDLMRIVADVRRILQDDILQDKCPERHLLIATGTDTAASVAHVLAEGVRPEDLRGRALGLIVSNDHVSHDNPATNKHSAIVGLTNGMAVVTKPGAHGRIGLCTGYHYHSPRGLRKVATKGFNNFRGRFRLIAKADEDIASPHWAYTVRSETPKAYEAGRGKEHDFVLASGIECLQLAPTSNYSNIRPFVEGAITDPSTEFNGLILIAPGDANLRKNDEALGHIVSATEEAKKAGIPMMLVADPLRPEFLSEDPPVKRRSGGSEGYSGSFANIKGILDRHSKTGATCLIDGGELTTTEATLLMSSIVARAKQQHGHQNQDIVSYTADCVRDYISEIG